MSEDMIRKTMRVGIGGVEVAPPGKSGRTRFSERLMAWIRNTIGYVVSQTGLSPDQQRDIEIAMAEQLGQKKDPVS